MKALLVAAVLAALFATSADALFIRGGGSPPPSGALLPADRDASANWRMAGLLSTGGIPNRTTQCGSTLAPSGGDDTSAINSAITACPAGDFVLLGSGTFLIEGTGGSQINLNKGVTLRGSGPGVTVLHVPNGATLNSDLPGTHSAPVVAAGGSGTITETSALTSDGAQGSYSIEVASATGMVVGGLVLVDELANGQSMPDCCFNGGTGAVWASADYQWEWNAHNPAVGSFDSDDFNNNFTSGDACDYSIRCGGVTEELHLITAISGNTITFDSPMTEPYRVANTAEAHYYPPSSLVADAGVEDLTLSNGDQGNLVFQNCIYCWAKNVESTLWLNAGGVAFYGGAFRDQLDTSYIHDAAWPVNGGGGYAINLTFGTSEDLVQNNIVLKVNKVDVVRASGAGTVFAYNYMDDGYISGNDGWIETGINCSHLVGSHGCLFEGNYSFNADSDFTHGSENHSTYFRNYLTGFRAPFVALSGAFVDDSTGCCVPQRAIADHAYSYWDSFIGNVAGEPGLVSAWNYRCAAGNADSGCTPALISLGWNDTAVAGSLADGTMALSYPTLPTGSNLTITGPGCVSGGSNCVPILDGNYDFKTDATQWATNDTAHTLPASLYLSAKPAFFGSYPWPWVTPDQSAPIQPGPSNGASCVAASYDAAASSSTAMGNLAAGGMFTWTLPEGIPAGSTAVVTVSGFAGNSGAVPAGRLVDNASGVNNSYRITDYTVLTGGAVLLATQYVATNIQGTPTTITFTASQFDGGYTISKIALDVFNGVNAIDGSGAQSQFPPGSAANAISSGAFQALSSGIVYGASAAYTSGGASSTSIVAGSGFTAAQSAGSLGMASEYNLSGASGSQATTFTDSQNGSSGISLTLAVALTCDNKYSGLPAKARYDARTPFSQP